MENLTPEQPKQHLRWLIPALVSIAGLMVAITLIARSNFLEGFLKLIGAGAARLQVISISSGDDFLGTSGARWLAELTGRNHAALGDTIVFNYFAGQPNDPGTKPGFVIPQITTSTVVGGSIPSATYTSPVIDLGSGSLLVKTIQVLDYQPNGSEIVYMYRAGISPEDLRTLPFRIIELSAVEMLGDYQRRQIMWDDGMAQFVQFQFTFNHNNVAASRPSVAELNIIYEGDGGYGEELPDYLLVTPISPDGVKSGAGNNPADLNRDGVVDTLDYVLFLELFATSQSQSTPAIESDTADAAAGTPDQATPPDVLPPDEV